MSLAAPHVSEAEERLELHAVLNSDILKKAHNLQHFLEFVAEKYFTGTSEEIKEYSIAIQALHRSEDFDPQADTIVRVTAHALRKKLEQYYSTEGADHPVQIQLPAGKYVLQFLRKAEVANSAPSAFPLAAELPNALIPRIALEGSRQWPAWIRYAILLGILVAVVVSIIVWDRVVWDRSHHGVLARTESPGLRPIVASDRAVRIHFGANRSPYMDSAGRTWIADGSCQGGAPFAHPGHDIQGTGDPLLFQEGREGKFRCAIPEAPGNYQIKLLFADTAGDKVAVRQTVVAINNQIADSFDVVDEAAGNDIAVGKLFTGVHPMDDGAIHLDFVSEAAFVNAVEIAPSKSNAGLPLRMLAGPGTLRDEAGNVWEPELFYFGGRRTFHAGNLPKGSNARLFEWERYGHFAYHLPVVPNREYKVSMYFAEGWFGVDNGGSGGIGSRVFDVYCNGTTLLTDFDILEEQKNGSVVMTAHHVRPTPHGALELSFTPIKNYPLINAIEVEAE